MICFDNYIYPCNKCEIKMQNISITLKSLFLPIASQSHSTTTMSSYWWSALYNYKLVLPILELYIMKLYSMYSFELTSYYFQSYIKNFFLLNSWEFLLFSVLDSPFLGFLTFFFLFALIFPKHTLIRLLIKGMEMDIVETLYFWKVLIVVLI